MIFLFIQADGHSALHLSALEGDEALVKYLITMKANAYVTDKVPSSSFIDQVIRNPNGHQNSFAKYQAFSCNKLYNHYYFI